MTRATNGSGTELKEVWTSAIRTRRWSRIKGAKTSNISDPEISRSFSVELGNHRGGRGRMKDVVDKTEWK